MAKRALPQQDSTDDIDVDPAKYYRGAQQSHDGCHCLAVPDRDGTFQPAPYVAQWEADYAAARNDGADTPRAIAQAMERIAAERERAATTAALERKQHADDTAVWLDAEDDYRHALAYWRRVDAEDLHSIPAVDLAEPAPPAVTESALDTAIRELEEAIDSGDEDRIDRAAAAVDAAETAERAAEAKAARAQERRAAKANAESDRIIALIDEGWEPAEAESEVTGRSIESIRRRDFIAQARSQGHRGAGFDELLASVFAERVAELAIAAENATNGYMVKRKYMLTVNPKQLWSVNDVTARTWMSEEMAAWFDENGRLTRPVLREMILRGDYTGKFNQQGEDYLQ